MSKLTKKLSKPTKIATTHALTDLDFVIRRIAEIMEIDPNTVMSKLTKKLAKPTKIATTHALTDLDFVIRRIAEIMEISPNAVMRYQKKELTPEWIQFEDNIKKIYLEQDFELTQLAVKHIKKKIGKAKFFELVGLLKTVRELQLPKPPLLAQQIKSDNITYIIQTTNDNQEFNRLTSEPVKDLSQSETE